MCISNVAKHLCRRFSKPKTCFINRLWTYIVTNVDYLGKLGSVFRARDQLEQPSGDQEDADGDQGAEGGDRVRLPGEGADVQRVGRLQPRRLQEDGSGDRPCVCGRRRGVAGKVYQIDQFAIPATYDLHFYAPLYCTLN